MFVTSVICVIIVIHRFNTMTQMTEMTIRTKLIFESEMSIYPYELQKGSRKDLCKRCGKKTFTRVIETATGRLLPEDVGRCDRESNCNYEYTWKQYFADNPTLQNLRKMSVFKKASKAGSERRNFTKTSPFRGILKQGSINKNGPQIDDQKLFSSKKPEYLNLEHLLRTLTDYEQNSFVQFLLKLFPDDLEAVIQAVKDYRIGTKDGFTSFPTISKTGKVCKAKLIKFNPDTGKRIKDDYSISSLEAKLKKAGKLNEAFETDKEVFFGEHLLTKYPGRPIAIVEAEKSAVIGSICTGVFPVDFVWLATGSKSWLKPDRIKGLGRDRKFTLYPDADGFDKWQGVALNARKLGLAVKVSNLIEKQATDAEKANQVDLADYLIRLQTEINEINEKIESVKADPDRLADFDDICEKRKAILIFDGGMSETEAEAYVSHPNFIRETILNLLRKT